MSTTQETVGAEPKHQLAIEEPDIIGLLQNKAERFQFQGGSAFAQVLANELADLRRNNEELTATIQGAALDLQRFELGHQRYEKLRRCNVPQFKALFDQNLATNTPFDTLVDALP